MNASSMIKVAMAVMGTHGGSKVIDPRWNATISEPQHYGTVEKPVTIPGYTQFDNYDYGTQTYMDRGAPPNNLNQRGYRLPDMSNLPGGQYNAGEAANAAWRQHMSGRPMPSAYGQPAIEGAASLAGKAMPNMGNVDQLNMSRVMNSWRRNAMNTDPAMARAFRMYSHPSNSGLLSRIGAPLKSIRPNNPGMLAQVLKTRL